jgi:DNA polymerase-4
MPAGARVVLHADMDAFYASVEQRDRPELRGVPVIVGGTGNRGVVSAASYEARRFGVHSAMPTVEARRLCPDGVYVRGDMKRYGRESVRIFEIFRRFAPRVQGLSLDEAFLDLTGTGRLMGPPLQVGRQLREAVRAEVGLAVSVGIAPVKMVAKIASDLSKPDGMIEVAPDRVAEFLALLPVSRIWGVGPVSQAKLAAAGFERVGDLAGAGADRVRALLGDWGLSLAALGRGEDLSEVEPYREPVSYSEENTFSQDVRDLATLEATARVHAESVARRLRSDGLRARTVVLKLKGARRRGPGPRGYPLWTRRVTLSESTDDGGEIGRAARSLLARAGLDDAVRLLGVGATNLVPASSEQMELFGAPDDRARSTRLNRALDEIAERFGAKAVVRGELAEAERAGLSMQIKRGASAEDARSEAPRVKTSREPSEVGKRSPD